jgi:hypothetical protein
MEHLQGNKEIWNICRAIKNFITRFINLCMAFSWLHTHSQGSNPSAIVATVNTVTAESEERKIKMINHIIFKL